MHSIFFCFVCFSAQRKCVFKNPRRSTLTCYISMSPPPGGAAYQHLFLSLPQCCVWSWVVHYQSCTIWVSSVNLSLWQDWYCYRWVQEKYISVVPLHACVRAFVCVWVWGWIGYIISSLTLCGWVVRQRFSACTLLSNHLKTKQCYESVSVTFFLACNNSW